MKKLATKHLDNLEIIHTDQNTPYENLIIFICGGGKQIGASRFRDWQKILANKNIGSVSFNFIGIENSEGLVENDSLKNRTKTLGAIVEYARKNYNFKYLHIYGVSMGGFTLLDYLNKNKINGKIILHAPAAYSPKAYEKNFNSSFSDVIRQKNSWEKSRTFKYLDNVPNEVLLIIPERDEVVTKHISDVYKNIVNKKLKSKDYILKKSPHSIWSNNVIDKKLRTEVLQEILEFIN